MRAYALMQRPERLEAAYRASPFYQRAQAELEAIRKVVPKPIRCSYRGVERYPLTEFPENGPGWEGERAPPPDPEPKARALLTRFLGEDDYDTPYPRAFLPELSEAKSVQAALCDKQGYELVELCSAAEQPRELIGFDVGYWGGGNFSILCDAVIWPIWHSPEPTALPDLARLLANLNPHGLFPSVDAANAYRDWYAQQSWAEEEPSEFVVIGVGRCD